MYPWYIGIPKGILIRHASRFVKVKGLSQIGEGVYLLGHRCAHLDLVGKQEKMFLKEGRTWRYDDFSHEQSLVFQTEKGLVVFNSCSHAGADLIIQEVQEAFPNEMVYALVGGLHLYQKSESYVRAFANRVKQTGIRYLYTGHCTKEKAYHILEEELGEVVQSFEVGRVMKF